MAFHFAKVLGQFVLTRKFGVKNIVLQLQSTLFVALSGPWLTFSVHGVYKLLLKKKYLARVASAEPCTILSFLFSLNGYVYISAFSTVSQTFDFRCSRQTKGFTLYSTKNLLLN